MSSAEVQTLASEVQRAAESLAEALAETPELDPMIRSDTLKVAGAVQRFERLWALRSPESKGTTHLQARQERHDLRTPVSQALGYLELVQEGLADLMAACRETNSAPDLHARTTEVRGLNTQVKALHAALESALGDFG